MELVKVISKEELEKIGNAVNQIKEKFIASQTSGKYYDSLFSNENEEDSSEE